MADTLQCSRCQGRGEITYCDQEVSHCETCERCKGLGYLKIYSMELKEPKRKSNKELLAESLKTVERKFKSNHTDLK